MKLMQYFNELVAKSNKTANSDEAKRIKHKLMKYGGIACVLGYIGVFICFASFAILGFSGNLFNNMSKILIPFLLIIPCGIVGSIGLLALKAGIAIVIVGEATKFVDLNKYCPKCNDIISEGEKFCNKCGEPLLVNKICKECGTKNEIDDSYCLNCGKRL